MRKAGVLLHISSLPSKYGIGTFGKSAYDFIDKLKEAKQSYWQILPLGPTSYGDSPYQSFSVFALNPYFIDLSFLVRDNLLLETEIIDSTNHKKYVNYEKLYQERFTVLKKAYERFNKEDDRYVEFLNENYFWLYDYALFMAIKEKYDGKSWEFWPEEIRLRDQKVLSDLSEKLNDEIQFHYFIQFRAYTDWYNLKEYANLNGIEIIGDLPIYVSYDSSDVWSNPNLFKLDNKKLPVFVSGVPPDNFSKDGQLWGNPIYNWEYLANNNYNWWQERIKINSKLFDIIRIDHFIGFVHYYQIPYGNKTAKNGVWIKGPGKDLFDALLENLGDLNIIAEDLGNITDEVRELLNYTKFPGMKLLQFAFDSNETNNYLPHYYEKNSITYTGTHDNMTSKSWFKSLSKKDLKYALNYMNHKYGNKVKSLIKETHKTISKIVIIPMQDYLFLDDKARFNIPSTLGNNWMWRLKENQFNQKTINLIKNITTLYGRE